MSLHSESTEMINKRYFSLQKAAISLMDVATEIQE